MENKNSRSWLQLFLIVLAILIMIGLIIVQEQRIAKTKEKLDAYKEALEIWAYPEKELVINEPEIILFQYEAYDYFQNVPTIFLKVTNTDLSECLIDNRLRVDLMGEIYWIRLER